MPIEVGDLVTAAILDLMMNPPLCRLTQQTTQTIASTSPTALTFAVGSEEVDTHNFHDETTNNTRVTPNVAGWYDVFGTVTVSSSTFTTFGVILYKNGASVQPFDRVKPAATASAHSNKTSARIYFNGTTDYVELRAAVSAAPTDTQVGGGFNSVLEVKFFRQDQS